MLRKLHIRINLELSSYVVFIYTIIRTTVHVIEAAVYDIYVYQVCNETVRKRRYSDFARVNIASKKNVARYSEYILSVLLSTVAMKNGCFLRFKKMQCNIISRRVNVNVIEIYM